MLHFCLLSLYHTFYKITIASKTVILHKNAFFTRFCLKKFFIYLLTTDMFCDKIRKQGCICMLDRWLMLFANSSVATAKNILPRLRIRACVRHPYPFKKQKKGCNYVKIIAENNRSCTCADHDRRYDIDFRICRRDRDICCRY